METSHGPGGPGLSDAERHNIWNALNPGQEMPTKLAQAPAARPEQAEVPHSDFYQGEPVLRGDEEWQVAEVQSSGLILIGRRAPNGEQQIQQVHPEEIRPAAPRQPTEQPPASAPAPASPDSSRISDALRGLEP